jgi:hypothetical protein
MCKMAESVHTAVETQGRIFCPVLKYCIRDPMDSLILRREELKGELFEQELWA